MFFVGSRGIVDCLLISPTGPGRNAYEPTLCNKLPEATLPIHSLVNRGVRLEGNNFVTITDKISANRNMWVAKTIHGLCSGEKYFS